MLIVSPRFPPTNAPDCHRVRLLIPYLAAAGFLIEVLAVAPEAVRAPVEIWLEEGLPKTVPIHRVRCINSSWVPGLGGLSVRSIISLYRAGRRVLTDTSVPFDLVFFSTTEFPLHVLGPLWKSATGVPFCMDYQDPWVTDYYTTRPEVARPGGRFKYAVASWFNRRLEPWVVRDSAGFLAVSRRYLESLASRYGERLRAPPGLIEPFPAERQDFDRVAVGESSPSNESRRVLRYVGAGGDYMRSAASLFFNVWRDLAAHASSNGLILEVIGTSYSGRANAAKVFESVAREFELHEQVTEQTARVPYKESLTLLAGSDGIVVFGSDDPAYTASKLYPCLLAGPPLLAILHEDCPAVAFLKEVGGCDLATFGPASDLASSHGVVRRFFERVNGRLDPVALVEQAFVRYTAKAQAERVGDWLWKVKQFAELRRTGHVHT